MEAGGVTVAYADALAGDALSLETYGENGMIPVITYTASDKLPEGAVVELEMQLATAADFSDATTLPVVDGAVSVADWNDYFRSKLGKSPAAKDNYVRFAAYAILGAQKSRLGGLDSWLGEKKVSVTPIPLDFVLQENYYLIGTINGWGLNDEYPFKHSAANVYDDPVFTLLVDITEEQAEGGWWYKIAPANAVAEANWDLCLGVEVDGSGELEGSLFDNGKAGCIKEAGSFLLTINVMDMTYSFKKLEFMYTPGNSNGWNHDASQKLQFIDGVYKGFAYLDGGFKFTSQGDWAGTNYGDNGDEEVSVDEETGIMTITGSFNTDGGAGNLNAPEAALYYCEVDVDNLTYKLVKINGWGMIGGFNSWGGDAALTPSDDFLTWTGELNLADASEWKFRANAGWDINLGGEVSNLTFGGSNISSGAGVYTVTLNLSEIPYTATIVK